VTTDHYFLLIEAAIFISSAIVLSALIVFIGAAFIIRKDYE